MYKLADLTSCISNAIRLKKNKISINHSNMQESFCKILKEEGFIENYKVVADPQCGERKKTLHVYFKYGYDGESILHELSIISKPSRRVYVGHKHLTKVKDGFGISILSTSRGIISSRKALKDKIGGELLCEIW